jgi:hypothetical protein
MGEIKTAKINMKERCERNMWIIRDLLENRSDYTHEFEPEELAQIMINAQNEVKECVDINVLNRRIRSCGK